jgi:hypothetical protein
MLRRPSAGADLPKNLLLLAVALECRQLGLAGRLVRTRETLCGICLGAAADEMRTRAHATAAVSIRGTWRGAAAASAGFANSC